MKYVIFLFFSHSIASAAVVYRETNIRIGSSTGQSFGSGAIGVDVDLDSIIDWDLELYLGTNSVAIGITSPVTTQFVYRDREEESGNEFVNFQPGDLVGAALENPEHRFMDGSKALGGLLVRTSTNDSPQRYVGPFRGETGFIGFQFERSGDIHYGYAEVNGTESGSGVSILSVAWEDVPNTGLIVFQSAAQPIPESSSTLLGMVALVLGAFRRRRCRSIFDRKI